MGPPQTPCFGRWIGLIFSAGCGCGSWICEYWLRFWIGVTQTSAVDTPPSFHPPVCWVNGQLGTSDLGAAVFCNRRCTTTARFHGTRVPHGAPDITTNTQINACSFAPSWSWALSFGATTTLGACAIALGPGKHRHAGFERGWTGRASAHQQMRVYLRYIQWGWVMAGVGGCESQLTHHNAPFFRS